MTTVVGLRQVGKNTLVHGIPGRAYVTLDELTAHEAAHRDPLASFLEGI